jgi:hypothetical protein
MLPALPTTTPQEQAAFRWFGGWRLGVEGFAYTQQEADLTPGWHHFGTPEFRAGYDAGRAALLAAIPSAKSAEGEPIATELGYRVRGE